MQGTGEILLQNIGRCGQLFFIIVKKFLNRIEDKKRYIKITSLAALSRNFVFEYKKLETSSRLGISEISSKIRQAFDHKIIYSI